MSYQLCVLVNDFTKLSSESRCSQMEMLLAASPKLILQEIMSFEGMFWAFGRGRRSECLMHYHHTTTNDDVYAAKFATHCCELLRRD